MSDAASWHTLSITLPFPTPENAELVKRVVQVDPLLRPSESTRDLTVEGSSLLISIKSKTLAQARVALDHLLSDVQLIVQTMHTFAPKIKVDGQTGAVEAPQTSDTMEVGLMGSWTGVKR